MRQTLLPQLVDDSRKLAQSLAAAAGVKLGAIRSICDSPARSEPYMLTSESPRSAAAISRRSLVGPARSSAPSNLQVTFSINVVFAVTP